MTTATCSLTTDLDVLTTGEDLVDFSEMLYDLARAHAIRHGRGAYGFSELLARLAARLAGAAVLGGRPLDLKYDLSGDSLPALRCALEVVQELASGLEAGVDGLAPLAEGLAAVVVAELAQRGVVDERDPA